MASGRGSGDLAGKPRGALRRILALPNDSPAKTLFVALAVSFCCAVLVSMTAVLLKPLHLANEERERRQYLLDIVARLPGIETLIESIDVNQLETRIVDIATGDYVYSIEPHTYDQRKAAQDPALSVAIAPERDIAKIKRRAKWASVYLVRSNGTIRLIILPVHGTGYASTLYGYLGLGPDANTVVGLSFYEQAETPGLGDQINDPAWREQWRGKRVRDETGKLRIGVAVGPTAGKASAYQVDGISGATWTSRGVHELLRFWLGKDGFGPYLAKLKRQEPDDE